MKVKDVMTKQVVSLKPNDTVKDAAFLMKKHNIGSIPVCDNGKIIGIITDRDIVLRVEADGSNVDNTSVRDVMSSNPVIGNPEMDIKDAAKIMSERQIRRLPIMQEGSVIGMVSLGDIAVEDNSKMNAEEALKDISEPCSPQI